MGTESPDTMPPAGNAPRAIHAMRWVLAGTIAQRIITFLAVAFLARRLSETEYGAYRQLLSVHLVLFVLLPLGYDQLYIREVRSRSRFAVLLGGALAFSAGIIAAIGLAGHWLAVKWMDFGPWSGMLWLAPAIVAVQAWKLIYKTDLGARLAYREITVGEFIYAIASSVIGVGLAMVWPVAWSLYIAYLLGEVAELLWVRSASTLRYPPLLKSVRLLLRFGRRWLRFSLFYFGNLLFNSVGANAPTIILGASFSKASAGAFSMANWLITVPIYILIGALHKVAFSALAGRNREQLVAPVLQMLRMSAGFIVPVLIYVAVMAEPIVHVLLGEKWVAGTAPVARWLSLYCVFQSLFSPVSLLDILLDRPDYGFYWNIVNTVLRVIAVVVGLKWDVMHAIAAYALVSAVMWFLWGAMLANLMAAGQLVFHRAWARFVPLWLLLGLMLWGVRELAAGQWAELLLSGIPIVLYTGLLIMLERDVVLQGLRLVRR